MKLVFIFLLSGICFVSNAQIVLKGKVSDFAGKNVAVFEYEDFFTRKRREKITAPVDAQGAFVINYPVEKPIYIDIFLNGIYSGVYVQPGFEYGLSFDTRGKVVSVVSADKTNELVQAYENRTISFYKSTNSKKNDKFAELIKLEMDKADNAEPFLREILTYRLAELQFLLYMERVDTSAINLLEKRVIRSAHINTSIPDYFNFIKFYAYERARSLPIRKAPFDFNRTLESLLKETTFIKPDSIRQLAALVVLRKAYRSDWSGPKDRVDHLTDSIHSRATNLTVKKIAAFVKQDGNAFNPGSKIDDFSFSSHTGETYKLSSFRGKYVLVDFWFTACGPCIKNFPKLRELKRQNPERLEIISLTPKDTQERVASFVKKHPDYTWLFSAIDKDDLVMSYFNIFYFPTYFLIDPDGSLVKLIRSAEMEEDFQTVADLIK